MGNEQTFLLIVGAFFVGVAVAFPIGYALAKENNQDFANQGALWEAQFEALTERCRQEKLGIVDKHAKGLSELSEAIKRDKISFIKVVSERDGLIMERDSLQESCDTLTFALCEIRRQVNVALATEEGSVP